MRLVTYSTDGGPRAGVVIDGRVVDLAASGYDDVISFLQGGDEAISAIAGLTASADDPALEDVKLHAPVPKPNKFTSGMFSMPMGFRFLGALRPFSLRVSSFKSACISRRLADSAKNRFVVSPGSFAKLKSWPVASGADSGKAYSFRLPLL